MKFLNLILIFFVAKLTSDSSTAYIWLLVRQITSMVSDFVV